MDHWLTIVLSGFASAAGTLIVLKTDMAWVKEHLKNFDSRITFLERTLK